MKIISTLSKLSLIGLSFAAATLPMSSATAQIAPNCYYDDFGNLICIARAEPKSPENKLPQKKITVKIPKK